MGELTTNEPTFESSQGAPGQLIFHFIGGVVM